MNEWIICEECGHKYMGSCINCLERRLEESDTVLGAGRRFNKALRELGDILAK